MKKLLIGLFFVSPSLLFAQGSQVNTQSQKAVSMAGAGSALFIDESSIFYNPGALAKMNENSIQLGASAVMYRSAFQESGSTDVYNTKFQISPPFSLFATFGPENSWWKAGIGVYTPFGGAVDWGNEWPGKYTLTHLSMRAIYIQPTLSFKITDNFSVGGGFVYNIGLVDMGKALPYHFPDGMDGDVTLKGTGYGTGYNIGVHYNLDEEFAISLSYRSKVNTKLENGDAKFNVPASLASIVPADNKFDAQLPLPASFNIGIAFPLGNKWDVAADATFIDYSIYKELTFNFEKNNELLRSVAEKRYQSALSGKVGFQYTASDFLDLRVGAGYVYSPVLASHVYPETPDNNRYMVAAGFTYSFSQKWDLSAAYVFQRILPRTSTNSQTLLRGTYKTNIHAPGISLTYRW